MIVGIKQERGFTEVTHVFAPSQILLAWGQLWAWFMGDFPLSEGLLKGVCAVEVDTELPLISSHQADLQHLGAHQLLVEQREPVVLGGGKTHVSVDVHARYSTQCLM